MTSPKSSPAKGEDFSPDRGKYKRGLNPKFTSA